MPRLVLKIEYDGSDYFGWQIQPNVVTVQGEIEKTLSRLAKKEITIIGAGRTDTGVHARGQIAHAVIDESFPIPESKLPPAINSNLPEDIRISGAKIIPEEFHSRYDAIAREYSYTIAKKESVFERRFRTHIKYEFNPVVLNEAAEIFIGKHNFTTFSKDNPSTKNYECNLQTCHWEMVDIHAFRLLIKADRFVYGMVRSLVGAMLDAARGKRSLENLKKSLRKMDRSLISPLAPAKGLILEKIYYPQKLNLFS